MRGRNSTHIRINVGFFIYICTLNNISFQLLWNMSFYFKSLAGWGASD